MKTSKFLLTVLAFCIAIVALADDIKIPTTERNPFDLEMGTVTSEDTHEHFTSNGLEWMRDGDCITFTLQNEKDIADGYVIIDADTGNDGVTIDVNLKNQNGTTVADTTFSIERKGWYNTKSYLIKPLAMAKGKYTLTLTFHSKPGNTTGNIKSISFKNLESAVIPTDDDRPFDLTKGFFISRNTHEKFTDNGVEYMYEGDLLEYILQNEQDASIYNFYVEAANGAGTATLDLSLKSADGTTVADTTFAIANKGWYNYSMYSMRIRAMKKGKYTLTFTFHQLSNTSWSAVNIKSISFRKPLSLKPGDDVEMANPEFDDGLNGWDRTGAGWNGTLDIDGNKSGKSWFNYGTAELSQTIYSLPDGLYMLRLCAYDGANYMTGNNPQEQETYIFANEQMKLMKTAFDESVSYRSIYRWRPGKDENSNFRHSTDGRWVPTQHVEWNEAKAMDEHFYENCLIVPVTNGKITFGWKKTGNSGSLVIAYDHVSLTYLSDKTTISEAERIDLETKQVIDDYMVRLSAMKQALRTELVAKRPHAPQAIAEAEKILAKPEQELTLYELIDNLLYVEHTIQRLQLPFYDITISNPGTLAELIAAQGIQTTDTIALKLNGTINGDDAATLKTLKNLMEVDLSDLSLTGLPDNMFNNRLYMLTWVTLPKQLEAIGASTFQDCPELRDLQLPATLKTIGSYAFRYSYNFYHANIPEGVLVGSGAFRNSGIRKVTLPSSMKDVPYLLCGDCYDLLDIEFNGQVNIESSAFWACYALKTLNIPEGIERLKDNCFGSCSGLTSATLPSTLLLVSGPFSNCKNLQELTCLTIAPPYPSGSSIAGDYWGNVETTLYVPNLSVASYQEADKWNQFNIVGIDTLPNYYSIISDLTLDMTEALPADYKPDLTFSGLYAYWGGDVTSIPTRGTLTVEGSTMLSTKRFTQYYTPFAQRSMANRGDWGPGYTSLINNGQLRADTVTIDLCLYTNCWEFLSFPFDVRVSDIRYRFANVPLIIYGYDAQKRAEGKHSETWVEMTADSILHAGKGYIWQTTIPQNQVEWRSETYGGAFNYHYNIFDIDAMQNANKPLFFRSDDVEVTLEKYTSEYAHDRSWNFIGNPYPCYFDIHCIETTAPLIVWTFTSSYNGRYQAYSPLDDDLILFPGQAFFMQCPLEQDKVVFLKEGRQHNLEVHYDTAESPIRARAMAKMPQREVFNLVLKGERSEESDSSEKLETLDRTRFVINPTAALDYEPGRDASKFFSLNAGTAHLYTHENGVRYAIDERPLADGTVQLGLQLPTSGTYTLQLDTKAEETVTLIDQTTGKETRMDGNSEGYTFYANTGTCDNRFVLYLGDAATGITEVATPLQQGEQQFYDLQGRPVSHPQKGIYIQNNKKVIIK